MNTTATTLSPPVLAARDIRKSYGKGTARFDALAGVSLSVYAGESIAIVGKSGSGKSTLMHLLALLDQPDDGTLMVGNTNADELSEPEPERSDPPSVYYENCTAVRNAGKAPIRRGDPGHGSHLDRDDDGVACET